MSDGKRLVAAIVAAGAVEKLRRIDRDWLEGAEQDVYDFVRTHYRRYSELPTIETVEEETRQRLPHAPENVDYYLQRVADRALYNNFKDGFNSLKTNLRETDLEAAKATIAGLHRATRLFDPQEDRRNLGEAIVGVMNRYEYLHDNPGMSGIPTAWPYLDAATGGYQDGDLIALVARMGIGKTYVLLKQAHAAWAAGYNVLVVTMEMTIEQIARRALGIESGVNPEFIRKGALSTRAMRKLAFAIDNMRRQHRYNLYAGGFSKQIDDVELLIEELSPDIVYIDGAYLLQPGIKTRMSRIEKVAYVYDDLKKMTITKNRPIVTTSQFSRAAGRRGRDGGLEAIAFTDAIAMHSSLVMSIKEGEPPYESTRRLISIDKGREGEHGHFQINYRFAPMDMTEVPRETREQEQSEQNMDWMA